MLKFKTFLKEGRDASLYHGTSFKNFLSIMKDNRINPDTRHRIDLGDGNIKSRVSGISFTRDFRFAKNWQADVVLELDQRKLTHNHKIVPFDYFKDSQNRRKGEKAESEEFIIGEIKNVKKYIIRIWIENLYSPYVQNMIDKSGLYGKFHFMELNIKRFGRPDQAELDYAISQSKILYKGSKGVIISPKTPKSLGIISKNTSWDYSIFDGNIYIVILKNGEKFKLDFKNTTVTNERKQYIDFDTFNEKYPWVFDNIKLSEKEMISIIKENSYAFVFLRNQSEKLKIILVTSNSSSIQFIKNPSEEVQMVAIQKYLYAITYIKNPTEKVQMYVLGKDSSYIKHIDNPTEKAQLMAVKSNIRLYLYIYNPTEAVKKYVEENK